MERDLMKQELLNESLYNKYIAPTKKLRSSNIGIEIELPVTDLSGKAVDEEIVISAADSFRRHFQFEVSGRDDNGNVNSMTNEQTGDNLSLPVMV